MRPRTSVHAIWRVGRRRHRHTLSFYGIHDIRLDVFRKRTAPLRRRRRHVHSSMPTCLLVNTTCRAHTQTHNPPKHPREYSSTRAHTQSDSFGTPPAARTLRFGLVDSYDIVSVQFGSNSSEMKCVGLSECVLLFACQNRNAYAAKRIL